MPAQDSPPTALPPSDVSSAVGLVGLVALAGWVAFAREWPRLAETFALPGPRAPLDGPHAAMTGLLVIALPMVAWSVLVDKVHRRPSTGIDWSRQGRRARDWRLSATKIAGLWATWAIIAALYCLGRWYWDGSYYFAMRLLAWMGAAMVVLVVPYVLWLDRRLIQPRDPAWHFGALLTLQRGWVPGEVAKHWRAWLIKAFFGAFMISIVPGNFANVVGPDITRLFDDPVLFATFIVNCLFLVDVMVGTVGYIVTLRPLDAHIRSGNPLLSGWVAALLCYPPFVWGVVGNGQVLNYEHATGGWTHWLQGNPVILWLWAGWLVLLTAIYAWATFAFGIRFSNLTYRGVLTNGPYRFTRHPAYLSKNLFWWFSVLPFLVTNGNSVDAIRNTVFLFVVNGIYYWRARTEEAHLLVEDANYRAYHAWMAENGLITALLTRLLRAIDPRRRAAEELQPAE